MHRRWTFRDRFGREVVAMPRAAASPEELSRAMDPCEAAWALDHLFPGDDRHVVEQGQAFWRLADLPPADGRLYSIEHLKKVIRKRLKARTAIMLRDAPGRRGQAGAARMRERSSVRGDQESPGRTPSTKRVWNLRWTPARGRCGDKLKLTGETDLPDGDLKLSLKTRELESTLLSPGLTATISAGRFSLEWEIKNVEHVSEAGLRKAFARVHVEATAADSGTPCNIATLIVDAVPHAARKTFDTHRTWNEYSNHSHFDQRIENFTNMIDLTLHVLKGWGATYVDLTEAGISGIAGGCPWDGCRWARSNGMSMIPDQYWDGHAWVALPAGFAPAANNYHCVGFYKVGSRFVSQSGGTWPELFADYDFNSASNIGVRARWARQIHAEWTDKFWIRRDGCCSEKAVTCCRYGVDVTVTFKEVASYSSSVVLVAPGPLRSNSGLWFMDGTASMPQHEAGHYFDNPDEYPLGGFDATLSGDGAVNGIDADSIMGRRMTKTKMRHYHAFAEMTAKLVNGVSGRHDRFTSVDK